MAIPIICPKQSIYPLRKGIVKYIFIQQQDQWFCVIFKQTRISDFINYLLAFDVKSIISYTAKNTGKFLVHSGLILMVTDKRYEYPS